MELDHGLQPYSICQNKMSKFLFFLWTIMYGARAHIFCIRSFFQVGTPL